MLGRDDLDLGNPTLDRTVVVHDFGDPHCASFVDWMLISDYGEHVPWWILAPVCH